MILKYLERHFAPPFPRILRAGPTPRKSMPDSDAKVLYDLNAKFYHCIFHDILRYGAGQRAFLTRSSYLRSNMKILDAGCGAGIITRTLYEIARARGLTDIKFHAFDISESMMDIFREWISENDAGSIDLIQADAFKLDDLPQDWGQYNLIVSSAMLEYLPRSELERTIGGFRELLTDGGRLVIFISRSNPLTAALIRRWWKANTYSRSEIENIFRNTGFRKITFERFPFPYWHLALVIYVVEAANADS